LAAYFSQAPLCVIVLRNVCLSAF